MSQRIGNTMPRMYPVTVCFLITTKQCDGALLHLYSSLTPQHEAIYYTGHTVLSDGSVCLCVRRQAFLNGKTEDIR